MWIRLGLLFWFGVAVAQSPEPKFVLSEVENLKLENLKLKQEVLNLQIKVAQDSYAVELSRFITDTLKAHGSPSNVVFDSQGFVFKVKQDKSTSASQR